MHWTDYVSFIGWALVGIMFLVDLPSQINKLKNRKKNPRG